MPAGLFMPAASLASSLVGPMPMEQVTPWASYTCSWMRWAMARGGPKSRRLPVTSRYASSMEATSTRSV